jgi:hypothetical protein
MINSGSKKLPKVKEMTLSAEVHKSLVLNFKRRELIRKAREQRQKLRPSDKNTKVSVRDRP